MKPKAPLVAAVAFLLTFAMAQSKGTPPHVSAEKYAAHASSNGASIGATRISDKQVQKTISPDVEDCCLVVEVGLYPAKDSKIAVALSDFSLRTIGEEEVVVASTPATVARQLPFVVVLGSSSGGMGAAIGPRAPIDSRTGGVDHDPVTGRPRRDPLSRPGGVDMGVGLGGSEGNQSSQNPQKSQILMKLTEKALPEGTITLPAAGYLYFSLEKKKGAKYQLQYTLAGNKIVLPL